MDSNFYIIGGYVHINGKVYPKEHLEKPVPHNCIGMMRYDKRTDEWEMYDPQKEHPLRRF